MGFAKYSEDIQEQIDINRANLLPTFLTLIPRPISTCKCVYCKSEFESNDALFAHMRLNHNSLPTVIQLNGKIIPPGEYIEAAIESLRVLPVKNIDSFYFNGNLINMDINNGYADLKQFQNNEFETLTIGVDGEKWIIHRSRLKTINECVHEIANALNTSILHRKRPDLISLKERINGTKLDIRDEQYINGLFEYCIACMADGSDKERLYFGAYNKLLPFIETDSRARLILKIICLRFLWVERLIELCKSSTINEFSLICAFLQGEASQTSQSVISLSDGIFEVFVEDDEYDIMQEIINFMSGNMNAVKRFLGNATGAAENRECSVNIREKIFLLQARLSEYEGNIDKARHYFNRILCPSLSLNRGIRADGSNR